MTINASISAQINKKAQPIFQEGIYYTTETEILREKWLNCKVGSLIADKDELELFPKDGTFLESRHDLQDERYAKAFQDIISRQLENLTGNKVLFLISHSCGVRPFMNFIKSTIEHEKPIYCTALGCKVEKIHDSV